jgi:arginine deiminase
MQMKLEKAVQVFDEAAPLEEVLLWGEPGCEALLGQLLPRSKSLFLGYYEVPEARQEFRRMQAMLASEGVTVIRAKDVFAHLLEKRAIPDLPASLKELERRLLQRADEYFEMYRGQKVAELAEAGLEKSIEDIYLQVKKDILEVLHEDAAYYGEAGAIRLNHLLSLAQPMPVSNIIYARDQSQTIGNSLILSSLKWSIRRPEVEFYKEVLVELGYGDSIVEVQDGIFEGGDLMIYGDTCYIGVGARTTLSAVKDIYNKIGGMLAARGIRLVAVVNERHAREALAMHEPNTEHMQIMHLDMFWIPLTPALTLGYGHEVDQRKAVLVTSRNGETVTEELGSFRAYLAERGVEILDITTDEQKNYAANMLNLGRKTLIVSLPRNKRVTDDLEARGFKVLQAELSKLVEGYGAIHCLTAPIRRAA